MMHTEQRMRGVYCVFVRYLRESHDLREECHYEGPLTRIIQWFDSYLKK